MQKHGIGQKQASRASAFPDKEVNGKRGERDRIADELIAAGKQRRSALTTFLVALIAGLVFWTCAYFIWQAL